MKRKTNFFIANKIPNLFLFFMQDNDIILWKLQDLRYYYDPITVSRIGQLNINS